MEAATPYACDVVVNLAGARFRSTARDQARFMLPRKLVDPAEGVRREVVVDIFVQGGRYGTPSQGALEAQFLVTPEGLLPTHLERDLCSTQGFSKMLVTLSQSQFEGVRELNTYFFGGAETFAKSCSYTELV